MQILLKNIYHLVTGDALRTRLRGVDLLIDGGKIVAVGENLPMPTDRRDVEIIDCKTKLVLPGLVNSHHHMFQTLQRNIPAAQSLGLFGWLTTLYPIWKNLSAEAVRISTQLACAELLKTGCTTTVDHHYLYPQGVQQDLMAVQLTAARQVGIRFCGTRGSMSLGQSHGGLPPDSVVQSDDVILRHCEQVLATYHDPSPMALQKIALAPCAPFNVSLDLMRKTADLARQHHVRLHTHLAETLDEEHYCLQHYGCRPLALMQQLGWVGPDVWYAHGIYFNDEELDLLAATQTGIAHCPSSNMRLGSGILRLDALKQRGVPVGLAVDGSASNDSSDMMGELRQALLLHRIARGPDAIVADDVLQLATHGSARLLGWDCIGSLEVGKAADLAIIEMNRLDYAGALSDPLAAIMYCGNTHIVDTTIVGGQIVVRNGQLQHIDEAALTTQANQMAKWMLEKAGHDTQWML